MSTNNSYKFQEDKKPAVKSSILSSSAPIFVPSASKPSFLTRQVIFLIKAAMPHSTRFNLRQMTNMVLLIFQPWTSFSGPIFELPKTFPTYVTGPVSVLPQQPVTFTLHVKYAPYMSRFFPDLISKF